jgi:hypothetical protein
LLCFHEALVFQPVRVRSVDSIRMSEVVTDDHFALPLDMAAWIPDLGKNLTSRCAVVVLHLFSIDITPKNFRS